MTGQPRLQVRGRNELPQLSTSGHIWLCGQRASWTSWLGTFHPASDPAWGQHGPGDSLVPRYCHPSLFVPASHHQGYSGGFGVGGRHTGTWGLLRLSTTHWEVYELWSQSPQSKRLSVPQIFAVGQRSVGPSVASFVVSWLMHRRKGRTMLLKGCEPSI